MESLFRKVVFAEHGVATCCRIVAAGDMALVIELSTSFIAAAAEGDEVATRAAAVLPSKAGDASIAQVRIVLLLVVLDSENRFDTSGILLAV